MNFLRSKYTPAQSQILLQNPIAFCLLDQILARHRSEQHLIRFGCHYFLQKLQHLSLWTSSLKGVLSSMLCNRVRNQKRKLVYCRT